MNSRIDVNIMNKTLNNYKKYDEFIDWFNQSQFDDDCGFKFNKNITVEKTALYQAIETGNISIINMLLMNNKINVNIKNKMNYYFSAYGGDARIGIKFELTALNLAIEKENIEIVKLLLVNNSIDVNLVDYKMFYGNDSSDAFANMTILTPLCKAIQKNNTEIANLLMINNNVDVNIKYTYADVLTNSDDILNESTPLYLAVEKSNIDIVNLLLNNDKLDVNSITNNYERNYDSDDDDDDLDFSEFDYFSFGKKFDDIYKDRKRYKISDQTKNSDLIKQLVEQKKIELTEKTKKLLK